MRTFTTARFALAGALLLALAPSLHARCIESGSRKKPNIETREQVVLVGETTFAFRLTSYTDDCGQPGPGRWWGAIAADGSTLVPPEFRDVFPLGPRHALVRKTESKKSREPGPWQFYEVGKGIVGPAPYKYVQYLPRRSGVGEPRIATALLPYGLTELQSNTAPGMKVYDYDLFVDGSLTPRAIRLGGAGSPSPGSVERHGDVLVANFTMPDGHPVSRLLDLQGTPITPVTERMEIWATGKLGSHGFGPSDGPDRLGSALLMRIPFTHPDLPGDALYVPILQNGAPRPLPEGVIGVFPLRPQLDRNGRTSYGDFTYAWGVVATSPQGLRITLDNDALDEVLTKVGRIPPVAGVKRFSDLQAERYFYPNGDYVILKSVDDGRWRAVDYDLRVPAFVKPESAAASAREAYKLAVNDTVAWYQYLAAKSEREKAEAEQRFREGAEKRYRELLAKGELCTKRQEVLTMHKEAIDAMLTTCKVWFESWLLDQAAGKGASREALRIAHRQNEMLREQALVRAQEEERKSRDGTYAPLPGKVNWEAWGNAVIRGMQQTTDSAIQRNRDTYYQNLDAWNRGAQNWGGPRD